jgi:hypothetical protein
MCPPLAPCLWDVLLWHVRRCSVQRELSAFACWPASDAREEPRAHAPTRNCCSSQFFYIPSTKNNR